MIARGKREAKRSASRLVTDDQTRSSPERAKFVGVIPAFQASIACAVNYQGRRASRLPLAFISRAFGALGSTVYFDLSLRLAFAVAVVTPSLDQRQLGAKTNRSDTIYGLNISPIILSYGCDRAGYTSRSSYARPSRTSCLSSQFAAFIQPCCRGSECGCASLPG